MQRLALAFSAAVLIAPLWAEAASIETGGHVGAELKTLPDAQGKARKSETWLETAFQISLKPNRFRRISFRGAVYGSFLVAAEPNESGSVNTVNQSGSPHFFEEKELAIEYRRGGNKLVFGSQTLRWGVSDVFDPLDQINSRRMENPLSSNKRAELMVLWERRFALRDGGALTFETFVIPRRKGALLPSQSSPWLPRKLYVPNLPDVEFVLPDNLEYRYNGREELDDALGWSTGIRLGWRPANTEFALQYDEIGPSFPSIRPTVTGTVVALTPRRRIQADPLIELKDVYYRERHYGFSMVHPFESTLVRLQVAKTEPVYSGRTLARDRTDFSMALEKQFSLPVVGQSTFLAQAFYNALANEDGGNDLASFSSLFDRAGAFGFRFAPSETTSLMLGALRSFPSASEKAATVGLVTLGADLTDILSFEAGWTFLHAEVTSPIGPFAENDGGFFKLVGSF